MDSITRKEKEFQLLVQKKELMKGLPHLYSFPFYKWSREFWESKNKETFLIAANQISKSSTQIRKVIHWGTEPTLWPLLWETTPRTFWYMYPGKSIATQEFEKKWVPEFLPRGKYESHSQYGWKAHYKTGDINALHFNAGPSVYFKSYGQDAADLQTATLWALFWDEELPADLYEELFLRLAATDGYMHGVFTATKGQQFWYEAFEMRGHAQERFKTAKKLQVSMYDCLEYEDGSPTPWNVPRIKRIEASCKSDKEVQKRVHGRCVKDDDLKYPGYLMERNFVRPEVALHKYGGVIPADWYQFAGVDPGSGLGGHPATIVLTAVRPDFKKGIIHSGRYIDDRLVTVGDLVLEAAEMFQVLGINPEAVYYDWHCKDAKTIAARMGWDWIPAEKGHDIGETVLNVLFRNEMLIILDKPELKQLNTEFCTLRKDTAKKDAKDDYTDGARYSVTKVPWDWSVIGGLDIPKVKVFKPNENLDRRDFVLGMGRYAPKAITPEQELEAYDELMGGFYGPNEFF